MTKICYIPKRFNKSSRIVIVQANKIIEEYEKQGFVLTLRQLYYQFVARELLPNKLLAYKRLASIVDAAKNAGLISWTALEDRTRFMRSQPAWTSPSSIVQACAAQYHVNRWETQGYAPELWIEKDALIGVVEPICNELDIPYFACRGYASGSSQWRAGVRFKSYIDSGREPIIFHLGDHDPSGIDMTRDNGDKALLYGDASVTIQRLALNIDQVKKYNPPPNPAKDTDSRFNSYRSEFGDKCWELDALDPKVIADLIRVAVTKLIDTKAWSKTERAEKRGRTTLQKIADTVK